MRRPQPGRHAAALALVLSVGLSGGPVHADTPDAATPRQAASDAWWTGPLIANTPATQPKGHVAMESYLFDVRSPGHDSVGSQTLIFYGLTDSLTVGMLPNFGVNGLSKGPRSSGVGLGDLTLHAQYRLTPLRLGSWVPQSAVALEQVLPTGRYQHLGERPGNGLGSGAYTTSLGYYAQEYLWLPNGRILRARLNLSGSVSPRVPVEGVSVYGTPEGFRGHARPGAALFVDGAFEYSLTRRWVLALDLAWRRQAPTRVDGTVASAAVLEPFHTPGGTSEALIVAPAVEYNWTPNLGVIAGVRVIRSARNATHSVTPVIALNAAF